MGSSRFNQKGSVQSTIVLVVSIATLLALAFVIVSYVKTQIDKRAQDKKIAQEIAEEGMQSALKRISENPAWTQGFNNVKCQGGYYGVRIEKTADSTFKSIATGYLNNVKTTLVCTYRLVQENNSLKPKPLSWEYE